MFKGRKRFRGDEKWDIFQIIPRVKIEKMPDQVRHDGILNQVQDDEIAGLARNDGEDIVGRFSVDLEERLKCNMGRAKEDACMLEKIINNKP